MYIEIFFFGSKSTFAYQMHTIKRSSKWRVGTNETLTTGSWMYVIFLFTSILPLSFQKTHITLVWMRAVCMQIANEQKTSYKFSTNCQFVAVVIVCPLLLPSLLLYCYNINFFTIVAYLFHSIFPYNDSFAFFPLYRISVAPVEPESQWVRTELWKACE